MKTNTLRASHVNAGTSVPLGELPWPEDTDKPVLELPKLHMEIDRRSEVTSYGGLALAAQVAFLLKIPKILNRHVSVLKRHLPYLPRVGSRARAGLQPLLRGHVH